MREQVLYLIFYFNNIKLSIYKYIIAKYTLVKISLLLNFYLEYWKYCLTLKPVSKPKATQSIFATKKVIFNSKMMINTLDSPNDIETRANLTEKSKTPSKKNKKRKNLNDN